MNSFSKQQHAYLIEGQFSDIKNSLEKYICQCLDIESASHPDVLFFEVDKFLVEHSREVSEWQSRKPLISKNKFGVLIANEFTNSAQNSLLKVLEDPRAETIFCLVVPNKQGLLETVLSRVEDLKLDREKQDNSLGRKFISANINQRLEMIKKNLDESRGASRLLQEIEEIISLEKDLSSKKDFAKPFLFAEKRFFSGGASHKNLLEYLAIHLPIK